eukprot:6460199-Amphidinium_carterae.2
MACNAMRILIVRHRAFNALGPQFTELCVMFNHYDVCSSHGTAKCHIWCGLYGWNAAVKDLHFAAGRVTGSGVDDVGRFEITGAVPLPLNTVPL